MNIIEIIADAFGGHNNQQMSIVIPCPDGWAIIPDDMAIPASFPYVDIVVVDGVVTEMTERAIPPNPPSPAEPTIEERMDDVEDALIDTDTVNTEQDTRLDDLENAILELANIVGGM